MTTNRHIARLKISLTVRGPFLTQSSAPLDYGIDTALARNKDNIPYVPGTLLIGKLREAWLELSELGIFKPNITSWLGEKSDPSSQDSLESTVLPKPKRLYINDLVLIDTKEKQEVNYRIRLDPKRGSVEKGAYLVTERPFAPGDEMTFQGTARFLARDETVVKNLTRHLEIGLKWISQLGAYRTIGFGELIGVNIEAETVKSVEKTEKLLPDDTYDIIICPESSFCISEHHIAGNNLFNSSNVIPGGVIKGTLATLWTTLLGKENAIVDKDLDSERQELCNYFDKIRMTHAFPGYQQIRPIKNPLSLVKVGSKKYERLYDVVLCKEPGLITHLYKDEKSEATNSAPDFSIDWKNSTFYEETDNGEFHKRDVKTEMGWRDVKRELRVRTKINSEKRRSEDEQLFAYEMVVPTDDIAWYGRLDLSDVPEDKRPQVVEQLQSLVAQGLIGLSKTKAYAQIELLPSNSILPCHTSNLDMRDGVWILTLQTPALLCNPDSLMATKNSPHDTLHQAYATVFEAMSDNSLELVRFFATQSLAGGFYLWKRFQTSYNYQPYLLTNEGSVFVLQPKPESTAKKFIEKWAKTGLPLPIWAIEKYKRGNKDGNHWSNCPYIPQNGYGEIAVNLSIHWDRHPKEKFVSIHEGGKK